jgi:hypothetical protein
MTAVCIDVYAIPSVDDVAYFRIKDAIVRGWDNVR